MSVSCGTRSVQVLATAGAGKDPFLPQPPPLRRPRRDIEAAADPDLETVGAILEGARLYVLSGLFVAGQAASVVLVKVIPCTLILRVDESTLHLNLILIVFGCVYTGSLYPI